jgi:glycyl-tRNA synthetase alpha subunit
MNEKRPIRDNEKELIHYLLKHIDLDPKNYPIDELVDEYEGGKMGSISLGGDVDAYDSDLIQVEYIDTDETAVVITLTKDVNDHLLDLDFWKIDFSRLIDYPTPDKIIFLK